MKLVLASNNPGKLREIREIMEGTGVEVLSQREAGCDFEAEETGTTFAENAYIKAKAVCDALNLPVKVAGKNKVEYESRLWSLSAFCGTYLPEEMHNKSESYQGPKYFSYQGKTLWEIRLEREN